MKKEKPTIISIELHGRKLTAELPWDANMEEISDALKGLLVGVGFHTDTVNEFIGQYDIKRQFLNECEDDECCVSPENCNIQAGIDIGISDCEPEFMPESESLSYEDAFEKDVCIHFAKWIAPSWMGIWVEDKWMWECLDEDMPKEHMGYKTDEELYELYLKSI
jgi:hypothetical protein